MKTEYRIVPIITFIADKYLQFKTIKKEMKGFFWNRKEVEVEEWRFIPDEMYGYMFCWDKEMCPTSILFNEANMRSCFNGQENYDIKGDDGFVEKYPNIEKYFDLLKEKRKEHLKEEEKKKHLEIEML